MRLGNRKTSFWDVVKWNGRWVGCIERVLLRLRRSASGFAIKVAEWADNPRDGDEELSLRITGAPARDSVK